MVARKAAKDLSPVANQQQALFGHLLAVGLVRVVAAVQLPGLLIDEADLEGVVVHDLLEKGRDARKHLARLERRKQRAADVEDRVPQRQLSLERRGGLFQRLILARVLDGNGRMRGEHLERLDQLECGQLPVRRIEEVQHAHELVVFIEERHEQVVVAAPLVGPSWAEVQLRQVVELLLGRPV